MSSYFPTDFVKAPVSKYLNKFSKGKTTFRIVGDPIFGNVSWVDGPDGKRVPNRHKMDEQFPQEEIGKDGVSGFLAAKCYNYDERIIQLVEISKPSILKELVKLTENKRYGALDKYDIEITKTGEAMQTRYSVMAMPPEALDPLIKKLADETLVELEQLFLKNGDPFMGVSPKSSIVPIKSTEQKAQAEDEAMPF